MRGHGEGCYFERTINGIEYLCKSVSLPDGRRKTFYGKTKHDLHAKERNYWRSLDTGKQRSSQTVRQYLLTWLESTKSNRRQTTYDLYEYLIRKHINPAVGAVRLTSLTSQHVQKMIDKSKASAVVINRARACLRNALNHAVDMGLIDSNPARRVMVPREAKPITRALTEAEVRRFFDALSGNRLEPLFVMAVMTGLREGELFALTWDDVDLKNNRVIVRYTLDRKSRRRTETKTESSKRIITLPETLCSLLRDYKAAHDANRRLKRAKGLWHENGLVFSAVNGKPLWERNIKRILTTVLKNANLPKMRFHDLRHSAATLMLSRGIPMPTVKEILGHTNIKTTDRYTHVLESMKRDAADKMGDLL